ncbi:MAG TPA: UPF0262 family protein [Stellaceae bacterium]|nr:UPF0262 family protein [Stellaceae bacterium]
MSTQRIVKIELDERSVVRRNADIEHERAVAIFDLLEENRFVPTAGHEGPFHLQIGLEEGRLVVEIRDTESRQLDRFAVALQPFRGIMRDYFLICESYYSAIRTASPSKIEAIDIGRRSLHNEGSELLRDQLASKVEIDLDTARRLFTLICVLHIRG